MIYLIISNILLTECILEIPTIILDFELSDFTMTYVFFCYQHDGGDKNATIFDISIFSDCKVNLVGAFRRSN